MERDLHSGGFSQYQGFPVTAGGDTSMDDPSSMDAMFSGISLLSLLTTSSNPDVDFCSLMPRELLLPQLQLQLQLQQQQQQQQQDLPINPHPKGIPIPLYSSSFIPHSVSPSASSTFGFFPDPVASQTLKLPKLEPSLSLSLDDSPTPSTPAVFSQPPLNFMPTDSLLFHHLPDLLSLDPLTDSSPPPPSLLSPFHKRRRLDSATTRHQNHSLTLSSLPLPNYATPFTPSPEQDDEAAASSSSSPPVMVPRSSALARQRRQKLSDKTRYLQKLLPWDKKMSIATMLEEAYKYVKFLQAQLTALHAMPSHSSIPIPVRGGDLGSVFGVLGRLNRNQLLQVLVNSPVAQSLLCSQGCCVFSVEQLDMLKKTLTTKRMGTTNSLHPNLFSSF